MLTLYRIVHFLAMGLIKLVYPITPKLKHGYLLRQKKNNLYPWLNYDANTQPIWFHCSSGEFEYALPLIRKIKEKNPEQKIMVTYFTPSYLRRIEQEPLVDFYSPAPWDEPWTLKAFIKHHQPKELLIARTDFWPEMIEQCSQAKVPIRVFSMTFSRQLSGFKKLFLKAPFRKIDHFAVVTDEDKRLLSQFVPSKKIAALGDTRYEQCLFRLSQTKKLNVSKNQLAKKLFIAGSTWPEDERVILPAIAKLKNKIHGILVPHEIHPQHIKSLQKQTQSLGLKTELYSQVSKWNGDSLLIIDEFGLLAHLYRLAEFSFIGGSFKKQVHSVMESLACGCLTFVGPFYRNNREAIEYANKNNFTLAPVQVTTSEDFQSVLEYGISNWTETDAQQLQHDIQSHANTSERVYEWLYQVH